MPSFAPILVWPLPSEPWHLAQDFSKFSFASPASALKAAAKPIAIASVIVFFIALFLFVVAALLALHFFAPSRVSFATRASFGQSGFAQCFAFFAKPEQDKVAVIAISHALQKMFGFRQPPCSAVFIVGLTCPANYGRSKSVFCRRNRPRGEKKTRCPVLRQHPRNRVRVST